jgi:hypothetical protein
MIGKLVAKFVCCGKNIGLIYVCLSFHVDKDYIN